MKRILKKLIGNPERKKAIYKAGYAIGFMRAAKKCKKPVIICENCEHNEHNGGECQRELLFPWIEDGTFKTRHKVIRLNHCSYAKSKEKGTVSWMVKTRAAWKRFVNKNGETIVECTACKFRQPSENTKNYCPNCGAEMSKRPSRFY